MEKILYPCSLAYSSSILGSGTKEMHPLPPFMLCTSGCVLLSFLKSTHILLCDGSPGADFFGTMTTGDAHDEMLLVMMPALSNVLISLWTHS